jgi:putative ABC transport system ATP-binding protein
MKSQQPVTSPSRWIVLQDVEKYYGNKRLKGSTITKAVNKVSFQVNQGEFVGIMGASGSGKTTLLNLMAAIDQVTSGHIYYGGQDIATMNEKKLAAFRRENLGFVFQDFNLLDNLTIEENIILAMTLMEKPKKEITRRLEEVTTALGIHDILGKYPYQVSGGQKQRCACARALANRPKLILADEPTGALDSKSSRMLLDSLQEMNDNMGATILMVTHDVFSASFCKRILFLRDGEIFHELRKGNKNRKAFLDEIFEVLSLTGGDQ